jgi:signal transduction histidine kinase/ligand-binding sensor domain-containing protein/CheY-like chemotaxis protein
VPFLLRPIMRGTGVGFAASRFPRILTVALAATVLITTVPTAVRAGNDASVEAVAPLRTYLRQNWQTADGLPQNSVRAIVQTREGYLWFGTAEGLARFDGNRFTVFDRTSTPSLPSGNIQSLAVASDGALWIGFRRHGLARLYAGQLTRWTTAEGLSGDEIVSLLATPDGSIWAGAASHGLNRIRDGHITIYRREQGLPDNDCYALALTADGGVLVGTATGAARVSDAGVKPFAFQEDHPTPVMAILPSDAGGLWLGTPRGLWHVEAGRQRQYTTADGLPSNDVTALVPGRDRTLWIAMRSGGLARLRDGRIESFGIADGLTDDFVHTMFEDRERNLWVGTNTGGVTRMRQTPFRTVSTREGVPGDSVRAVFESRDGSMWVGTPAQGLARLANGAVTRWTTREGLPVDGISMIGESRDGSMWIGTLVGLIRMKGGSLTRYTRASGLPHENVRSMFEDRDGGIWIGTFGGVCRIEGDRCRAVDGLNMYARGFHQSADGDIWIAGYGGLFRYHDGRVAHWSASNGLSSDFVTSLAGEPDGTMWLSTADAGLNRFKDGRITRYGLPQGLYDETIYRVLADGRGGVWMTSNRGLFRVARSELDAVADGRSRDVHCQVYTETDGLRSPEFVGGSFPAGMVTRNGLLWLPSVKGVVIVDPARMETAAPPPPTHLERVVIDGRSIDPDRPARAGPGAGRLEFSYTAFQFVAPARLRFRYKLEGFDPDWVDAGPRRTAYYTSLPPGRYAFKVQASNDTRLWGPASTTAAIALAPRFYQTLWFVALCVVVGGVLIFGGVNARTARLRAQERRLRAMVDARTRELQEEVAERTRAQQALVEAREAAIEASRLKSEFLANMSHEIRTPMNGIIGMTELALDRPLLPDVREYLQIVQTSADGLLHVINDVLNFSKIEAGRLELVSVDFALRDLVDDLVALLGPQAAKKGLALAGDVASDVAPRLVGDPQRLRQVLTNLVGNALKFTEKGEIRIEVRCAGSSDEKRPAALRFAVRDTGIGIAETDLARIFDAFTQVDGSATRRFGGTGLGLAISSQLVGLMGGRLEVDSAPGRGSTFSFVLDFGIPDVEPLPAVRPSFTEAVRPLAVLLAEDGAVNQLLVRRLLERAGHSVTVVDSGVQALEALARSSYDIVLMDIQMPHMDGFEATAGIRARENNGQRRVPVIALTAHVMEGDRERCLAAGMDGYLSKPIRADALFAALAEHTGSACDAIIPATVAQGRNAAQDAAEADTRQTMPTSLN